MESIELFFRTLFMYFFILMVMRLMGKREIGKLSVFDLVVSIMIADLAVIFIENGDQPVIQGILPIVTLMVTQIALSYLSLKNQTVRHLVDGKPAVLIEDGKIREKEMARNRYNLDDLMAQLREKNIDNIADVEFAILETSGKLSVFPKEEKNGGIQGRSFSARTDSVLQTSCLSDHRGPGAGEGIAADRAKPPLAGAGGPTSGIPRCRRDFSRHHG